MDIQQLALWVIDVDRRLIALKAFGNERVLHPSDIAKKSGRSVQNISRALREMERKEIVKCIGEKNTWRKYLLTDKGKKVLDEVKKILEYDDA